MNADQPDDSPAAEPDPEDYAGELGEAAEAATVAPRRSNAPGFARTPSTAPQPEKKP